MKSTYPKYMLDFMKKSKEFTKELRDYIYDHPEEDIRIITGSMLKVLLDFAHRHDIKKEHVEGLFSLTINHVYEEEEKGLLSLPTESELMH